MELAQCSPGQRVRDKETGKVAAIKSIDRGSGFVEVEFDGGGTARLHPRRLHPVDGAPTAEPASETTPMRDCPQCAAKFPLADTTCPACGFQFREKKSGGMPSAVKFLIVIIVLAGIAFAVWKFVLNGKLP